MLQGTEQMKLVQTPQHVKLIYNVNECRPDQCVENWGSLLWSGRKGRRADEQTGRWAGGRAGRWAGRRVGKQTGRRADGRAGGRAGGRLGGQVGGRAHARRAGRRAVRQVDGQVDRRAGRWTGWRVGRQWLDGQVGWCDYNPCRPTSPQFIRQHLTFLSEILSEYSI